MILIEIAILGGRLGAYLNTAFCQRHQFQWWATSLPARSPAIPTTAARNEPRSPRRSFVKNPMPFSGRRCYTCRSRLRRGPLPERACSTERAKRILNIVLVILLAIRYGVRETESLWRNLLYYPGKCRRHANIPYSVTRLYGGLYILWIRSQVFVKYLWILPPSSSSSGRTQPSRSLIWIVKNNKDKGIVKKQNIKNTSEVKYYSFRVWLIIKIFILHLVIHKRSSLCY